MKAREIELQAVVDPTDVESNDIQNLPKPPETKVQEKQDSLYKGVCYQLACSLMLVVTYTCVKISNSINDVPNPQIILIRASVTVVVALSVAYWEKVDLSEW
eukprot:CAMPEP_0114976276 /NCGR_PEP_ID=MMETSP0216-20121206/2577_1 /TAXON_ID=223996 /ORGANISM="Protocruzia adherens, Strain Boccale" /LENGTH=101 /DNA_ID=CAMNT_0002337175 /DNA_START=178 /DNA_END=480 /DNA_ORIENTATION=-